MGSPDIKTPPTPPPVAVPKNTATPTARKLRRPKGLDAAQTKAARQGTSKFRVPTLGLNIPNF